MKNTDIIKAETNRNMEALGFITKMNGKHYHPYFGVDVEFDMSLYGSDTEKLIVGIFERVFNYGREEQANDIKDLLNIKH